jgi:hypothetical protein
MLLFVDKFFEVDVPAFDIFSGLVYLTEHYGVLRFIEGGHELTGVIGIVRQKQVKKCRKLYSFYAMDVESMWLYGGDAASLIAD